MPYKFNSDIHHRRSMRLKDYDYSQAGAYFVTVCTQNRECIFGEIEDGRMILNETGKAVQAAWDGLPNRFPGIVLDAFTVMPNHCHGIVVLVGAGLARPNSNALPNVNDNIEKGAASSALTLGTVIRALKAISAINANGILCRSGRPVWQRNYYDHIIRSEDDMNKIREYVETNPSGWHEDEENPLKIR